MRTWLKRVDSICRVDPLSIFIYPINILTLRLHGKRELSVPRSSPGRVENCYVKHVKLKTATKCCFHVSIDALKYFGQKGEKIYENTSKNPAWANILNIHEVSSSYVSEQTNKRTNKLNTVRT